MLYDLMDKGPLRALSLLLALLTAGGVMWDPTRFASQAGQLPALQGLVLIWDYTQENWGWEWLVRARRK